jgi:hypothetical protein
VASATAADVGSDPDCAGQPSECSTGWFGSGSPRPQRRVRSSTPPRRRSTSSIAAWRPAGPTSAKLNAGIGGRQRRCWAPAKVRSPPRSGPVPTWGTTPRVTLQEPPACPSLAYRQYLWNRVPWVVPHGGTRRPRRSERARNRRATVPTDRHSAAAAWAQGYWTGHGDGSHMDRAARYRVGYGGTLLDSTTDLSSGGS